MIKLHCQPRTVWYGENYQVDVFDRIVGLVQPEDLIIEGYASREQVQNIYRETEHPSKPVEIGSEILNVETPKGISVELYPSTLQVRMITGETYFVSLGLKVKLLIK